MSREGGGRAGKPDRVNEGAPRRPGGRIPHSFFRRDPLVCAHELIGCELIWDQCAGIVVETEAYSVSGDEACHTFARKGARQFVEVHEAGAAYVYLNYGVHWLLNVLVKGGTEDGFVLIRALEPTRGIDAMRLRRKMKPVCGLCSGPGKLSQALGVQGADHGIDLCSQGCNRFFRSFRKAPEVIADVRVGISKAAHLPWRFLMKENVFVSVRHGRVRSPLLNF